MPNSIVITVPHRLDVAEARQRIAERMELLRRDFISKIGHGEVSWKGDAADVRVAVLGQTVTGTVLVMKDSLRIEVHLPWLLAALAGKIKGVLQSNAEDTLRIGHSPPKA